MAARSSAKLVGRATGRGGGLGALMTAATVGCWTIESTATPSVDVNCAGVDVSNVCSRFSTVVSVVAPEAGVTMIRASSCVDPV